MKKFISIIAAVSMLLSLCVVNVSAATSAQPSLNIYAEPYDGTNPPSNYKPGDYDVYKVWYTTAGVDTAEDMVVGLEIKLTIDDESKVAAKSWSAARTSGATSVRDANGVYNAAKTPTLMSKGYYSWADPASGVDVYDWDTYPDGGTEETLPYIETLIYVTAGETVTFTYANSMLAVDSYDADNYREFTTALQYNVNGVAGNVLTLGASAPTEEITNPVGGKVDAVGASTDSDNLRNLQGEKVTLTQNYGAAKFSEVIDTEAKNYFLVLTDTADETVERAINFAEQGIEAGGANITFFAIVKAGSHVLKSITLKATDKE